MNKKKSFIFTLLMAIVLSFTPVHASTETEASSTPVTAIFNLHDEYQEETFYDENGVSVTLSVTHTPSNSRALSNGQYTIKGALKTSARPEIINREDLIGSRSLKKNYSLDCCYLYRTNHATKVIHSRLLDYV